MKKIILFSLLLLVLVVVGCETGQAVQFSSRPRPIQIQPGIIECGEVVGGFAVHNFNNGKDLCRREGYSSCTSAIIVGAYDASSGVFQQVSFPADCESNVFTLLDRVRAYKELIDPPNGGSFSSGETLHATCCKIR